MDPQVEKFVHAYEDPFWQEVLKREAEYLRKELAGCQRILDVGCGVGVFERQLAELNIVGADNNGAMLAEAKKASGGDFVQADALRLSFRGGTFDAVFFVTSLEFTNDYRLAIAEASRVLKKGGVLVAMILNPRSHHFKDRRKREGSYLKNARALEPARARDYASNYFRVQTEYFLGIREGKVLDSVRETVAGLYVLKGRKLAPQG